MAHFWLKEFIPSASNLIDSKKLSIITGIKTFNSKFPWDAPIPIVVSFPITWTATIVRASHCVGFTFPGIIEEPGSFDGIIISDNPHLGPLDNHLTSFAIFIRFAANAFKAPWA